MTPQKWLMFPPITLEMAHYTISTNGACSISQGPWILLREFSNVLEGINKPYQQTVRESAID